MEAQARKRIPRTLLPGLMLALLTLLALPPAAPGGRDRESVGWTPAPGARELTFRGLRVGMTLREAEAVGFRRGGILGHASGAVGYRLIPQRPGGLREVAAYFVHEGLFELSAAFEPMTEAEARTITARVFRDLRAPADAPDGLRRVARWTHEGVIVRYSVQPMGEGLFSPDLLLQDETGYLEARVYFSQIEYSH